MRAGITGFRRRAASSRRDRSEPSFTIGGERETCLDVLARQIRKVGEDLFDRHPRSEVTQQVGYGDPHSADARLAATLARFDGDDLAVVHTRSRFHHTDGVSWNRAGPP